ncbi:hypothetical protein CQA57_00900 [Helicobacter anseris]|uniref:Probable membrane transporter protein n=1 Tax=Helicobacter anseris TaxID=375926 RepID=A0A3D8JBE5_9HELI|nr:sulfite exporter TauE/SafE family protein [Helicobacter anseris]RDU74640.1 hypothetical protein CQA57_00900 [Helicobacter anseris]
MEGLYIVVGIISGIASGMFGLGGGTIIVPMMLSLGFSVHQAVGISVLQMIFASLFGSIINYKKRLLSLKDGVLLGIGGVIGASFSGKVLQILSETKLTFIFLLLMCLSFYNFLNKKNGNTEQKTIKTTKTYYVSVLIFTGMITGIFSVSLGVGGGLLMMPILMHFLGFDTKKISVLSLFFIICSSISGALSLFQHQIIDFNILYVGLFVGVSAMIGVSIGIFLVQKITLSLHKRVLSCIYVFAISLTTYHLLERLI